MSNEFTYNQVRENYDKMLSMSVRDRYKYIHTLAFQAKKIIDSLKDLSEVELALKIFKEAGDGRALSKVMKRKLEIMGISEIKTLTTKSGVVNIESGMLALGDPQLGYDDTYEESKIAAAVEAGNLNFVGTGGDGALDVIVRLIDSPEPMVSDKEYKFIESATEPSVIKVISGRVRCGDFWAIRDNNTWQTVDIPIENGMYKCAFFHKVFADKFYGYVAVLTLLN